MRNAHLGYLFFPISVAVIIACGTVDFGKSEPDFQEVSMTNPTWEQDIKPVVDLKCQNCHGEERHPFSPGNTPPYENTKFDKLEVFKARLSSIKARMSPDAEHPMPPHFATPLTAEETQAFQVFFAKLEKELAPTPTPSLPPGVTPTVDPKIPKVKFSEVSGIISSTCSPANCHSAGKRVSLNNLENIKKWRDKIATAVVSPTFVMPPATEPKQLTAQEKEKLINWAKAGTDD